MADADIACNRPRRADTTPRRRTAPRDVSLRIVVSGRVQGVGFRPFVYRLARDIGLTGYVQNCLGDVDILACGSADAVARFERALLERAPPLSRPRIAHRLACDSPAPAAFEIRRSTADGAARISLPPDYYMCEDCSRELRDPADRRYRYPFLNCTQCGPRYTLITALPYDRPNTAMGGFPLCAACAREYGDPGDRRFHAEPVACPACGPALQLRRPGATTQTGEAAIAACIGLLRAGKTLAVRGIGGYHLLCDATSDAAVLRLRARKRRPAKPLAVMFPYRGADGLAMLRDYVLPQPAEAEAIASPVRPIVLAAKRADTALSAHVAPGLAELGVFLPYSPLHTLLLGDFGGPLVATSGNVSGEPVLIDEAECEERLDAVADAFLHHDRPIVRPADDPVMRRSAGRVRPLRLGRGNAPAEFAHPTLPGVTLSVGAEMKGAVALSWAGRTVVSPHIGEMQSVRSLEVFERLVADFQRLYGARAERVVCDAHPGYTTHRWAERSGLPLTAVWHHHAHASALAGEYAESGTWLVFTWDGVGLGEDGTLWGGEALLGAPGDWRRVASLRPFRPVGGDRAGREPWRSAAALFWECGLEAPPLPPGAELARAAWQRRLNAPATSAAGRLFDAAAALVLGCHSTSFEAEGPMYLEALCRRRRAPAAVEHSLDADGVWRSDWSTLLPMLADASTNAERRAEVFHASMARIIVEQAERVSQTARVDRVGLCGGVFQNRVLTEIVVEELERRGFEVRLPVALPVNDAAISFGQAVEAQARGNRGVAA